MTFNAADNTEHHIATRGAPSRRMTKSDTEIHIWNTIEGMNHCM